MNDADSLAETASSVFGSVLLKEARKVWTDFETMPIE